MSGLFLAEKKAGETLAMLLRRFREEHDLLETEKITYAGRLDPMAEGSVPLLVGDMRFQKDRLLHAAKTYEVDVLLGMSTDTGDMLGLATPNPALNEVKGFSDKEIAKALETLSAIKELPYPHYSSRPVDGTPLFMHARAGNKVQRPMKKISIHNLELLAVKEVSLRALLEDAIAIITKVHGDFRQEEIVAQWSSFANATAREPVHVQIVTIRATVSSGTYMRSLAEKMGELLGLPALAYHIKRTSIEGMEN